MVYSQCFLLCRSADSSTLSWTVTELSRHGDGAGSLKARVHLSGDGPSQPAHAHVQFQVRILVILYVFFFLLSFFFFFLPHYKELLRVNLEPLLLLHTVLNLLCAIVPCALESESWRSCCQDISKNVHIS